MKRVHRPIRAGARQPSGLPARFALSRSQRAIVLAVLGLAGSAAAAPPAPEQLPTGGQVTSGVASISQSGTRMDVVQSTSRAVVEWASFDIGRSAHVNFAQPGASSVVLNRVLDANPSQIFGRLTADGQVFLSNPSGVYFSPTASVDVGGLVATSARTTDATFMGGVARFEAMAGAGAVTNEGRISAASGGYVALLAPEVRNSGAVVAELGTVALAAGSTFDLRFDGRSLADIRVGASELAALVDNGGAVIAPGGRIVLSAQSSNALQGGVVRTSGTLEATGMTVGEGGRILLEASHDIELSGAASVSATAGRGGVLRVEAGKGLTLSDARIDASGTQGGAVVVSGQAVVLEGATRIDAGGVFGGGRVRVGGGFQGRDSEIRNAEMTAVGRDVSIRAEATNQGDGGEVVVWSDGGTAFLGSIFARGGAQSGNGGMVEVSGRQWLGFAGHVDAGAAHGKGGTLLLDPKNLVVSNAVQTDGLTGGVLGFGTNTSGTSIINPGTITAVTNTGTAVTLQASNDLSVDANIISNNPGGSGGDLNLVAGRSVSINAFVNTDGGNLNVTANAAVASGVLAGERDAGAAQLSNNGFVLATGGDVNFTMASGTGHAGTSGSIAAGAVFADSLAVTHQGPTAGGTIDLGSTVVGQLTVVSNSARDVTNSFGDISVQGAPAGSVASFDAGGGNVTLTAASNDFDILQVSGANVIVNDLNSIRLGASAISGNFTLTSHGPIASVGDISVAGATVLDAQAGSFGVLDPNIDLNRDHSFLGPVRIVSARDVVIKNLGPLTLDGGPTSVDGDFRVTTVAGAVQVSSPLTAGGEIRLAAAGNVSASMPLISVGDGVELIAVGGDIAVGDVSGTFAKFNATGGVSAGAVVGSSVFASAGATSDIDLSNVGNQFGNLTLTGGRDATIVNSQGVTLGVSTLNRNLLVQAAGTIGAGALTIGGSAQFTVTAPGADLLLSSSGNLMSGPVSMATAGAGSYRNLAFSNGTPVATMISGFPASSLNDVSLEFANAPAFAVPAMSITGNLTVSLPGGTAGGGITQLPGGIRISPPTCAPLPCVPDWKGATFSTAPASSITLTDPANQLVGLKALSGNNLSVVSTGLLDLGGIDIDGNLAITNAGNIVQSGPASVAGSAGFAVGANSLDLDDPGNAWNIVRITSAGNVVVSMTTNTLLGTSTVTGSFRAEVPDALVTTPSPALLRLQSNGEAVELQGTTTFRNINYVDLETGILRLGPIAIAGPHAPEVVLIREDHDVTQASAWDIPGAGVRLTADNGHAVLMTNPSNRFGETTLVGNVVSLTENDDITQFSIGPGWQTTGTTTLNSRGNIIDLGNPLNQFGPIAISGGASSVSLVANSDLTQASAWALSSTPITLDAGVNDVVLGQAANQLGPLAISAQNASVVEDHAITQSAAWVVPGLTTVNAGSQNINLSQAANDFGTIGMTTTGDATLVDANAVSLGASNVGGTLALSAAGNIGQSAGILAGVVDAASGGAIQLNHADNEIVQLGNVAATTGLAINDKTGGLDLTGIVRTNSGDLVVHTEGGALKMLGGSRVESLGAGNAVLAAGVGFDFENQNTGGIPAVLVNTGRFLIYTTSQVTTTKGNLAAGDFTGFSFAANPPATIPGADNRYLYAHQVFLSVVAADASRPYGFSNPVFTYSVSGFLPGDNAANTLTGLPSLTSVANANSGVGVYPILASSGSLANTKGYGYTFLGGSLAVTQRPLSLAGSKFYDGIGTIDAGSLSMTGAAGAQTLGLSGSASLPDPRVGAGKQLDVSGLVLSDGGGGGLAANYALSGPHRFAVLSPLTGLPVVSMPLAPEAPPARTASERSFRNVPGLDAVHTHLLAAFGTFMVPGDLEPPSPDATLSDSKVDPSATALVQVPVRDMPAPEIRIATLADTVPVIRGNDLPPQGVTIVFGADEAFAHGKASLSPAGRMLLEREIVQPYRAGRPIARLMITGHADPTGSESYNRRLSRRRALAGQAFLLERGIPAAMIQAEGRGSSKSLPGLKCAPGDIACLGPERRIEIHVAPRR